MVPPLQTFPTKVCKYNSCHPHPTNYAAMSPFMVKNVKVATLETVKDVFDMSIVIGNGLIDPYTQFYNFVTRTTCKLVSVVCSP